MNGSPPGAGWWWVGHCSAGKREMCLQTPPPCFAHETPYLQKDGEGALGGLIVPLVGVVQCLGCRLSALRTLAWLRRPEPTRGGGAVP